MDIFKRKKEEIIQEEKASEKQIPSNSGGFRNSIKIENYGEKIRFLRLKEDLLQGKIEEKDLTKEELDEVAKLLKGEIVQYDIKIKNLQTQIAKYKKNN